MKPLLQQTDDIFFKKLIKYHGYTIHNDNSSGRQFYIDPFIEYNFLLDTNAVFSNRPTGDIIDRTESIKMPFKFSNPVLWTPITFEKIIELETCFNDRVQYYNQKNQRINLFWSGGIDSTAFVAAFLKYSQSYNHLKIYYTVWSVKENPFFYLLLKKIPNLEMIDYAGDEYFLNLTGINITGDVADEITASLDSSFFNQHGYEVLQSNWQDFFYSVFPNSDYIDFCNEWFKLSGLEIKTVLEARWWFYVSTKYYTYSNYTLMTGEQFECFYATRAFELYWGQNTHNLISKEGYHTYKQNIKDFIYTYDKNSVYQKEKSKFNSSQIQLFRSKKNILQDQRFIAILEDGTRIKTDNLPFLNEKEYRDKYGNSLEYLFNTY